MSEGEAGGPTPEWSAAASPPAAFPPAPAVAGDRPVLRALGLAAFCLLLFLTRAGAVGVFDRDEARFALAVREMSERSDLVVPTNFGELRFKKPVGIYWLGLAAERVLGPGERALRFPPAVCATLVALATALLARRWFGPRIGWRAGFVLATSLLFVVEARSFTADAALLLGTTASFAAWSRLREDAAHPGRWRVLLWASVAWGLYAKLVNVGLLLGAACALAFLEGELSRRERLGLATLLGVGAVGAAFPRSGFLGPAASLLALGFFVARTARDGRLRRAVAASGATWGIPLALGLFAAWGVPALLRTGGAFWTLGVRQELLGQAATQSEGHGGPPGFYLATTLIAFLPWSALLPAAIARTWPERRRDPRVRFLAAWVLGPWIAIELFTSKLPHYALVTLPALATLVSCEWERRRAGVAAPSPRARVLEAALLGLPALALAAAAAVVASRAELPGLRAALVLLAAIAAGLAGAGAAVLGRGARRGVVPGLGLGFAALWLAFFAGVLPAAEPLRLARALAPLVAERLRPDERLIAFSMPHASVGFALPRVPEPVRRRADLEATLRGDARAALVLAQQGEEADEVRAAAAATGRAVEPVGAAEGRILPRLRRIGIELLRVAPPGSAAG